MWQRRDLGVDVSRTGGIFDIVILGAGSGGYAAALRAAELNLSVALIDKAELIGVDMAGVNAYKDGVVSRLHKGLQGLMKQPNITLVQGAGKLVSQDTVEVDGQHYTGRNIILATGSYSRSL